MEIEISDGIERGGEREDGAQLTLEDYARFKFLFQGRSLGDDGDGLEGVLNPSVFRG